MMNFTKIAVFIFCLSNAYADEIRLTVGSTVDPKTFELKAPSLESKPYSLNMNHSVPDSKSESVILECNDGNGLSNTNEKTVKLAKTNLSITKILTCGPTKFSFIRFDKDDCNNAIICRKNLSYLNNENSEKLLNEIVAKDYADNMLNRNFEEMDQLETLKRFAKEKYGIKGDKCDGRYQPPKANGTCDLALLDDVFIKQQEKCKDEINCFQNIAEPKINFRNYKATNTPPKLAFIVDYNEYRIKQEVEKLADEDDDFIDSLASLVTKNDIFKAASAEQKADMFIKKLESGGRIKDPILAYEFKSLSNIDKLKTTPIYTQLLDTYRGANLTESSFKNAFEKFRKKRAEIILTGGSCSETKDIKNICEEMTKLAKGEKVQKDSSVVNNLSSREMSSGKDFERFKNLMGDGFLNTDFDKLVTAKRCIAFGLANENFTPAAISDVALPGMYDFDSFLPLSTDGPNENMPDKRMKSLGADYIGDTPAVNKDSMKLLEPKDAELESGVDKNTNTNTGYDNTQQATNDFPGQFNQPFTPGAYGFNKDDNDNVVKPQESSSTADTSLAPTVPTPTDPKMTELMKRLASAEEEVDKLKAAKEEADKQQKINEENALIKDLKTQIADLKAATIKKENAREAAREVARANNPIIEQPRAQTNNSPSSFVSSGSNSTPVRQEAAPKVADNFESARSSASATAPSASSSVSRSPSSVMLNAVTNTGGNKVLPSGLVLTTVDGMSSEKVTQTISNKIIELNGMPFFIEEGGMVKEIIAVVKDGKVLLDAEGKPIFEKIVKGKVGDRKFASGKEENRAPAAITNVGDLKRDQEEQLKRQRAEYLKLRKLTDGILNK